MTTRAIGVRRPRHLLARILETLDLAQAVQGLDPKVLHQIVRHCGLEDCGEIVALATTEQLIRVFDDDLWRSDQAGQEDGFDADRFGVWLEVLAEASVSAAADRVAEMDVGFVTAAVSRYLLVLDQETLFSIYAFEPTMDGDDPAERVLASIEELLEDGRGFDLGGYRLIAKRAESSDALLSILIQLEQEHRGFFGRVMRRCCQLATEYIEDNGGLHEVLTADEQVMADMAGDREERREQEGYVTPAEAVAFLKLSRERPEAGSGARVDPVTAGYFRELAHRTGAPVEAPPCSMKGRATGELLATLQAAGVVGPRRLSWIRSRLGFVQAHDAAVYARRTEELAYLANVLVAGCPFQSRRFRAVEAADAVLAVCNLGLENWPESERAPAAAGLPEDLLLRQDLVAVFRIGWSVLHEEACLHTARRLVDVLAELQCDDVELQDQLADLRRRLKLAVGAGTPWRERDNLDVIAILDQPSWLTLLGLIAECPVVPKVVVGPDGKLPLRVSTEFEFISDNAQLAWVREFGNSLPQRLT